MAGAFNGLEQDLELLVSKGSVGYQALNRKHESKVHLLKKGKSNLGYRYPNLFLAIIRILSRDIADEFSHDSEAFLYLFLAVIGCDEGGEGVVKG
jgi:hypothetical protein